MWIWLCFEEETFETFENWESEVSSFGQCHHPSRAGHAIAIFWEPLTPVKVFEETPTATVPHSDGPLKTLDADFQKFRKLKSASNCRPPDRHALADTGDSPKSSLELQTSDAESTKSHCSGGLQCFMAFWILKSPILTCLDAQIFQGVSDCPPLIGLNRCCKFSTFMRFQWLS